MQFFFHVIKTSVKPLGLDIFAEGLALIGAEPRHIRNQCIRLVVETGNDTQNALERECDSQEKSDADSLTVEPDMEPRVFSFIRSVKIFL